MSRPRVWAPAPDTVDLLVDGRRVPMERGAGDWWSSGLDLPPGTDYAFMLDGTEPALPDPRSPWQPHGVDGASRTVDLSAPGWTDASFRAEPLSRAIIYELHVGTFSDAGTFDGAIRHLDHVVALGITHVELMPVNEFSGGRGWGYDGVDLYAPHHAYGGPSGLARLVDACHARGLAVILDVVYNHLGPAGNYLARFGPYFTDTHASPWGPAVNFDAADSDEVRRFVLDNALMWLRDYHIDALRLDAVHAIADASALHILEEMAIEVRALAESVGRPLAVIAESDLNDPRVVGDREAGGYGLDAQWSDDFHHALHTALTGERSGYYRDFKGLADVARALQNAYVYDGQYAAHRRRRHGRAAAGLPADRFVGYAQNHDHVGNRAMGERLSHLVSYARAQVGAALVLTAPFVPLLFMGEEWAASTPFQYFTDHADAALGDAVRTGRRTEFRAFGWDPELVPDPQDPTTFDRSRIRWDEVSGDGHAQMLAWYRDLIRLRRSSPDLLNPHLDSVGVHGDPDGGTMLVRRGSTAIAVNLGSEASLVDVDPEEAARHDWDVLLASSAEIENVHGRAVRLPADSVAILRHRTTRT